MEPEGGGEMLFQAQEGRHRAHDLSKGPDILKSRELQLMVVCVSVAEKLKSGCGKVDARICFADTTFTTFLRDSPAAKRLLPSA